MLHETATHYWHTGMQEGPDYLTSPGKAGKKVNKQKTLPQTILDISSENSGNTTDET